MLAHMKAHPTKRGEIILSVPPEKEALIADAVQKFLELSGLTVNTDEDEENDDDRLYSYEEVFPDSTPGKRLNGVRTMEGMTQAQFAERLGIKQTTVSDMERGARPISKKMAKRIEKEFGFDYRVFM